MNKNIPITNLKFELNMTLCRYQGVDDWLRAVGDRYGNAIRNKCEEKIHKCYIPIDVSQNDVLFDVLYRFLKEEIDKT